MPFDPANYEGQDRLAHIEKYLAGMSLAFDASTGLVSPTLGGMSISATTFSDDFERTGTFAGSDSSSGYTWENVSGAGTLSIVSGRLTVDTAGNGYAQMELDSTPLEVGGVASWVTGGGTDAVAGGVTLISSNKDFAITDAVHFNIANSAWQLQVVVSSSFTTLISGNLTTALDGTPHPISLTIRGNTATVLLPDGTTQTATDSRIGANAGRYVIYELGNVGANAPKGRWESVYAKESVAVGSLLATLLGAGALASQRRRGNVRMFKLLLDRGSINGFTDTLTNLYVGSANQVKTDGQFNAALGIQTTNLALSQNIKVGRGAPAYSASITPNYSAGEWQAINATNGTAFTINAPTNAPDSSHTADIAIEIQNSSGGALGTITFDPVFVGGFTFTAPANTKKRAIYFRWNGSAWVYVNQSGDY